MAFQYIWTQSRGNQFGSNVDPPISALPETYHMAELDAPVGASDILVRSEVGISFSLVAAHNTSVPLTGWQAGGSGCFAAEVYSADGGAWPDPHPPGTQRAQNSGWLVPSWTIAGASQELGGFVLSTPGGVQSKGVRDLNDPLGGLPAFRVSVAYHWPFFVLSDPNQWSWTLTWYVRALWKSPTG